jgi:hypothetical protein
MGFKGLNFATSASFQTLPNSLFLAIQSLDAIHPELLAAPSNKTQR